MCIYIFSFLFAAGVCVREVTNGPTKTMDLVKSRIFLYWLCVSRSLDFITKLSHSFDFLPRLESFEY